MMDVTALSSLLTVLLVVTELQILTNGVMCVVDLLAATTGLKVDLDADVAIGTPCRLRRIILA